VGALILNLQGEMLLVRSPKWGNKYTIAGGHVEVGERLVSALRREIKEEVGIRIKDIRFLLFQEALFSPEFWKPKHFIFFDFVCRAIDETPKIDGREVHDYSWVDPRQALSLSLDSYTRRMVEEYLHCKEGGALTRSSTLGMRKRATQGGGA
jgi:nucleoside triphosphatase